MNPTQSSPAAVASLPQLALQIAVSQLGVSEKPVGSNSGPEVDEYLASVGLKPGYAWCQSFVHWCYEQAAKQLGVQNPVIKTAGVQDCWNKTAIQFKVSKHDAILHSSLLLKPGDQFMLSYGHGAGHTGIVEKIEGLVIHTIEGNSNNNGSREGYEVVRHQRSLGSPYLLGFIKY